MGVSPGGNPWLSPLSFYWLAVQPSAGRSNQMWTCPVPTAFSYSEIEPAGGGAVRAAGGGDRHEVVAEPALGGEAGVVVHRLDDAAVIAGL